MSDMIRHAVKKEIQVRVNPYSGVRCILALNVTYKDRIDKVGEGSVFMKAFIPYE